MKSKNNITVLKKYFGVNEYGFPGLPAKISGKKIARMLYNSSKWDHFYPYGFATHGLRHYNILRNWKKFRKTRWKTPLQSHCAPEYSEYPATDF